MIRGQYRKGYDLTIWADGFREWYGLIRFDEPLGNTAEAEKMIARALNYAKRNLRGVIARADAIGEGYRLQYEIIRSRQIASTNQLIEIELKVLN